MLGPIARRDLLPPLRAGAEEKYKPRLKPGLCFHGPSGRRFTPSRSILPGYLACRTRGVNTLNSPAAKNEPRGHRSLSQSECGFIQRCHLSSYANNWCSICGLKGLESIAEGLPWGFFMVLPEGAENMGRCIAQIFCRPFRAGADGNSNPG